MDKQPTRGATARFERLTAPLPATILLPSLQVDGAEKRVDGTIVHIAVGCMCLRLSGEAEPTKTLAGLAEGEFAQVEVPLSDKRRFWVEGRIAWLWAPSMEQGDTIASLGIDILGASEENLTLWGKLRQLWSRDRPLQLDRTARPIATRRELPEVRNSEPPEATGLPEEK